MDKLAEYLLCHNIAELDKRFIVLRGTRSFIDLLLNNPFYKERIEEMGLTPEVIKSIGRCLFSPVREVVGMVRAVTEQYPAFSQQKVVGIRISDSVTYFLFNLLF